MNRWIKRWWPVSLGFALTAWVACGDDETGTTTLLPATSASSSAASGGEGPGGAGGSGGTIIGSGGTSDVPGCDIDGAPSSEGACVDVSGATKCNPVTNDGCEPGQACDVDGNEGFVCYPPPNDGQLCTGCDAEACEVGEGPCCTGGLTCAAQFCLKYCCEDDDCGSGACIQSVRGQPYFPQAPNLGVCIPGQTP